MSALSVRHFSFEKAIKEMQEDAQQAVEEAGAVETEFKGWRIFHEDGSCMLELVKDLGSTKVTIKYDVQNEQEAEYDPADDEMEDGEEEDALEFEVPFEVEVEKSNSPDILTFDCMYKENASPPYEIRDISIGPEEIDEDEYMKIPTYRLSDDVNDGFHDYLQELGVDGELMDFLIQDAVNSVDSKEYKALTDKIADFIAKK